MQLQQDMKFADRYELKRLIGRGGFSEVWLAEDSLTGLQVALKVYAPGGGMDNDGLKIFGQELAGVYNLNHSNLLRPQHMDQWENMPYLIMAYCEKGSLTKQIGQLSEQQVWQVIHDVAAGLEYLHGKDIVHQDIKPDNILVDANDTYLITDFGISSKARTTLRRSAIGGALSGGTMAYMGPERFSKQPAPTKASDIWSLGAMIYEVLDERLPFGEMGGGMQKGGAEIPEIEAPVSDSLKQTIYAMLAKETWDRPQAEKLVIIATAALKHDESYSKTPVTKPKQKKKWIGWTIAVLVVIGLAVGLAVNSHNEKVEYVNMDHLTAISRFDRAYKDITIDNLGEVDNAIRYLSQISEREQSKYLTNDKVYDTKKQALVSKLESLSNEVDRKYQRAPQGTQLKINLGNKHTTLLNYLVQIDPNGEYIPQDRKGREEDSVPIHNTADEII